MDDIIVYSPVIHDHIGLVKRSHKATLQFIPTNENIVIVKRMSYYVKFCENQFICFNFI